MCSAKVSEKGICFDRLLSLDMTKALFCEISVADFVCDSMQVILYLLTLYGNGLGLETMSPYM